LLTSDVTSLHALSMEFFGMRKKIRAAAYPRVSDQNKKDSATLESQEADIRRYINQQGYELLEEHVYPEAMTAYMLPFRDRPQFTKLLEAAKRHEFDVVIVTEYCRLSRRQIEQAVIIDLLQRYGVRIEAVTENFDDSAIGNYMRSTYAFIAEVEREKTFYRTNRGRKDRAMQTLTGQGRPTYGYLYEDTKKYTNGCYVINHSVFYIDHTGYEWSEYKVVVFIYEHIVIGWSLRQVALHLTELGVPTRTNKPYWSIQTISSIATNRWYTGKNCTSYRWNRNGKSVKKRDESEQIKVPDGLIPPIISEELFNDVQAQLAMNKQFAMRNNKHPDIGILRAGLIVCGICGQRMHIRHHDKPVKGKYFTKPEYFCDRRDGRQELIYKHTVSIQVEAMDQKAWETAKIYIKDPALVRKGINELREEQEKQKESSRDIEASIANIRKRISNLIAVAEGADEEEVADIKGKLANLRRQKAELENMVEDVKSEEEIEAELEEALIKFEEWTAKVRPFLDDPDYEIQIEDQRTACVFIGIVATVFPVNKEKPDRGEITVLPPSVKAIVSKISGSR
jgi:site-specific DNA recombinase